MEQFSPPELISEFIVLLSLVVAWYSYRSQVKQRAAEEQAAHIDLVKWRTKLEARVGVLEEQLKRLDKHDDRIFDELSDIRTEIVALSERLARREGDGK